MNKRTKSLFKAIEQKNLAEVQKLIEAGADVNENVN